MGSMLHRLETTFALYEQLARSLCFRSCPIGVIVQAYLPQEICTQLTQQVYVSVFCCAGLPVTRNMYTINTTSIRASVLVPPLNGWKKLYVVLSVVCHPSDITQQ